MRRHRDRVIAQGEEANQAVKAMADATAAAAAAQERHAAAAEENNRIRPDLRINALAFAIQSFAGRETTTSEISLRAESFFLFLSDGQVQA